MLKSTAIWWLAIAFPLGAIACTALFGCGASFVGDATAPPSDTHWDWTNCLDGTFCPPAYPVCVQPLSNGGHCESADAPSTHWGKRVAVDAGK
jgi:hypothetical protein